jgi:hypothetical protein
MVNLLVVAPFLNGRWRRAGDLAERRWKVAHDARLNEDKIE